MGAPKAETLPYSRRSWTAELGKNVSVKKVVAKLAVGIQLLSKSHEIRHPLISRSQLRRRDGEQLSPMWPRIEGLQLSFNMRDELAHCRPILLPSEMDADAILLVGHAHPQIVVRNCANLRNQQVWANHIAQSFDRQNGFDCLPARNEIF